MYKYQKSLTGPAYINGVKVGARTATVEIYFKLGRVMLESDGSALVTVLLSPDGLAFDEASSATHSFTYDSSSADARGQALAAVLDLEDYAGAVEV